MTQECVVSTRRRRGDLVKQEEEAGGHLGLHLAAVGRGTA